MSAIFRRKCLIIEELMYWEVLFSLLRLLTAVFDQKNHKIFFESLALQAFQKISWFGFERKALYQREPWLFCDVARKALREAIEKVRLKYSFSIDAFVLLPDHFHCLWTLPPDDQDLSVRLRLT